MISRITLTAAQTNNLWTCLTTGTAGVDANGFNPSKVFDPNDPGIGKKAALMFLSAEGGDIYIGDDPDVSTTHYGLKITADTSVWDATQLANAISLPNIWFRPSAASGVILVVFIRFL